ncbi:MAG: winged helix DNA-binding protein [Gammaproteobacteria bacterium]|nr:winged helix DNA-binding protein [Gammaproteobacteria bacterium]
MPDGEQDDRASGAAAVPARADELPFDTHWHLGRSDREMALAEFEYSLFRVFAAFDRWQMECLAAVANKPMSSTDNAVLHIIRMKDRPKTIAEIGQLLNRDDIPNLQYSIRKLQSAAMIEKYSGDRRRGIAYRATANGRTVTDRYADVRAALLMPLSQPVADWDTQIETTRKCLNLLRGLYEQAAVFVATHRSAQDNEG